MLGSVFVWLIKNKKNKSKNKTKQKTKKKNPKKKKKKTMTQPCKIRMPPQASIKEPSTF